MPPSLAVILARVRMPLFAGIIGFLVAGSIVPAVPELPFWLFAALFVCALVILFVGTVKGREPVPVQVPVTGRWLVFNSPGQRVPSHGVQSYGQSHAIDLIYDPADDSRPYFARRPVFRRPEEFPGFGQPVLSPGTGTVVRVLDRERDHRARTSPLGLLYLFTVELLREFFGPGRVVGNHVIIDLGEGVYAMLAHLKRGSITVAPGDRVTPGRQIAECGNSGNSSEPHLHFQLMDHRRLLMAAGRPFRFHDAEGAPLATPKNLRHLEVTRGPQPGSVDESGV
jgi:hypothetical protein